MTPRLLGFSALAVGLGGLVALQSRINGELGRQAGGGLFPAWLTMVVGLVIIGLVVSVHGRSRAGLATVAAEVRSHRLPWWTLVGGLLGAMFLIVQSAIVPLVGVAVFTVGVVAGMTGGSLLVDSTAIGGVGRRPVTARRAAAAAVAVVAILIAVSDRLTTTTSVLGLAVLAFLAGAVAAPQQAINGRVATVARSPFSAALVNFTGGAILMSVVIGVALAVGAAPVGDLSTAPWWAYLGGPTGLIAVAIAATVVPTLGVLLFSLLSVFGQLSASYLLDVVMPTPGARPDWHLVVAIAVTFGAILLAAGRPTDLSRSRPAGR